MSVIVRVLPFHSSSAILEKLPAESKFSEDESREYFIDILLGLEYCESSHVIITSSDVIATCPLRNDYTDRVYYLV